jgi:hypothetical protein
LDSAAIITPRLSNIVGFGCIATVFPAGTHIDENQNLSDLIKISSSNLFLLHLAAALKGPAIKTNTRQG